MNFLITADKTKKAKPNQTKAKQSKGQAKQRPSEAKAKRNKGQAKQRPSKAKAKRSKGQAKAKTDQISRSDVPHIRSFESTKRTPVREHSQTDEDGVQLDG